MKEKGKGLLWGVLIGSVAGSVTALLLAPKSGKELRGDIADGARGIGSKVQEVAEKVGEQGVNLIGIMTDRAENVISDIQSWRNRQESWLAEEEVAQVSSFDDEDFEEEPFASYTSDVKVND
ncbi:general stress protein [Paenibacillus vortex V453]|jgi:gas vesicle protein|uniref:General stress protein n=2 Tax=Paenibacillus TaxID=44249 RepID=A0A163F2V1_9BACL|nr:MULTISPECIES: YtxH domain-containing protein [Paenibacillus]ANA78715.1 general stress protein [Paenibacillus glucanolyticus]AVV57371.1 YtxH domain-containing protein [Paenibacillus glucanolyticus]AWP26527.1 general stress protein [Paenibacillus sp. Cedars]EFU39581.1 general stress protein [Paenibacillus vortex V453]ETT35278.1 general stress protein [Paenibacillus sp. FSL R5-808]